MCENLTMNSEWGPIAERIRLARTGSQHTQDDVARALGVDRTSVVRMEAGQRKINAVELAEMANLFDVPVTYLLAPLDPVGAVVSRRGPMLEDPSAAARDEWRQDVDLETHARDVAMLAGLGLIGDPELRLSDPTPIPGSKAEAELLARSVRQALDLPVGPLPDLAGVCERWGLYLLVIDRDTDGASTLLDAPPGVGAAVIGGRPDPGRRRATAAHELGHHLFGDAYSSDVRVSVDADDRERVIDWFARALLLPTADVRQAWPAGADEDTEWHALVRLAGSYRVSWTLAVQTAREAKLINSATSCSFLARRPVRGDFLAQFGTTPNEDLVTGTTGPAWKQAVLTAHSNADITGGRALVLLHGAISSLEDLPTKTTDEDGW